MRCYRRYKKFPLVDTWSALINTISWQLPAFLLAFFFSPFVVGLYALGFQLLQLPMNFIGNSISQVFFAQGAEAHHDRKLDKLVFSLFSILVLIGLYPFLTITIIGSDIFTLFFGEIWAEAGFYAQILSLWTFVWFLSSPLSTVYIILEKQDFGLKFNLLNILTRFGSLLIGGILGNVYIALGLFSVTGVFVYGYLCLKTIDFAGASMKDAFSKIGSNIIHFVPSGIILCILKYLEFPPLLVVISGAIICSVYYLYMIKTNSQIQEIICRYSGLKRICKTLRLIN